MDKNKQIAETMRMTYERRSHQDCHVLELKVNKQHLNKQQQETLKMLFVEAKWCYNYILNKMEDISFDINTFKGKQLSDITHKDKNMNDVSVHLNYITSSIKDSLVDRIKSQLKTLSTLKKKGKKVGKLQYKSEYNSLGLKQLNVTHKIVGHNRIKIQGIKKPLFVNGLKQLNMYPEYEIANAILHKREDNYYIYLTIYVNKQKNKKYKNKQIGIDLGCETTITLSDGTKINAFIEESDHIKKFQKKLNRQVKKSNNRYKTIVKLHKEYQKLTNIKNDLSNKIVHKLLEDNEQIIMQDEQLNAWKVKHGKKIQHSVLGRIKKKLARHENQVVILNKKIPTTKLCSDCGYINRDIKLWDRTFICPKCGCIHDRDFHAAENMIWIFNNLKNKIGLGKSKFKPVDFDEEVHRLFYEWDSQSVKQEDAKPLV